MATYTTPEYNARLAELQAVVQSLADERVRLAERIIQAQNEQSMAETAVSDFKLQNVIDDSTPTPDPVVLVEPELWTPPPSIDDAPYVSPSFSEDPAPVE